LSQLVYTVCHYGIIQILNTNNLHFNKVQSKFNYVIEISNFKQKVVDLTKENIENNFLTIEDLFARLYTDHLLKISVNTEIIITKIINNYNLIFNFRLTK
jgi:hypothetical protein